MKDLVLQKFSDIDLADPFFDSLRSDYEGFSIWFENKAKAGEKAYLYRQGGIKGFLYLKEESGVISDVSPSIPKGKHIKVGTFKIIGHGTKLGQRFVKKIFDHALSVGADDAYVTIFQEHVALIKILKTYGFCEYAKKTSSDGEEIVLLKNFKSLKNDILLDYPLINIRNNPSHLLAIYPEYHTKFLPDSKLNNESFDIVKDVSHSNSIHKIYISGVAATGKLKRGDILVMYRTTDKPGKAYYRSVATSIGVVEEARRIGTFATEKEFLRYVSPYSVFDPEELLQLYATKKRRVVIKFTYNAALSKRVIRKLLLEEVGLPAGGRRWDFLRLTPSQFNAIASLGQVNESYIVD